MAIISGQADSGYLVVWTFYVHMVRVNCMPDVSQGCMNRVLFRAGRYFLVSISANQKLPSCGGHRISTSGQRNALLVILLMLERADYVF